MAVIIREVVSEVVLEERSQPQTPAERTAPSEPIDIDDIVRRATERVLEALRREWER